MTGSPWGCVIFQGCALAQSCSPEVAGTSMLLVGSGRGVSYSIEGSGDPSALLLGVVCLQGMITNASGPQLP